MAANKIFTIAVVNGGYIVSSTGSDTMGDNRQIFTSKAKVVKFLRDEFTALEGGEVDSEE
jgi:hypothetical protein